MSAERASRFLASFKPEHEESFETNLEFFRGSTDRDALGHRVTIVALYTNDPRGDICAALKAVELEKGWRP